MEEYIRWDNIGSNNRSCLILHYVADLTERMRLSDREAKQLHQVVAVGFNQRYFGGSHVTLVNWRIDMLTGLLWDRERRRFYISSELRPSSGRSNTKKATISPGPFLERWQKYIEYMDRIVIGDSDNDPITTETTEDE